MSDKTGIEWTDATWNPVTGCTKVSAGCKHCYAERVWPRLAAPRPQPNRYTGREFTDVACHSDVIDQPLAWTRPRRIFVNSMSDLFHPGVPDYFLCEVFERMEEAPHHTFQVLTKRPARMAEFVEQWWRNSEPSRHIWLGVSAEDQATANERIPLLLQTPAAVRWVSAEPLLGQVDIGKWLPCSMHLMGCRCAGPSLDWVVVGGESGPKARPMHPDWVSGIRDQCAAAGTPFLFKQWGEWLPIDQQEEAFTNGLYRSNKKAQPHEDQCALDESYGRTCTVDYGVVHADGTLHDLMEPMAFLQGRSPMTTFRVGKERAGRLLDGVQHDGYPEEGVVP